MYKNESLKIYAIVLLFVVEINKYDILNRLFLLKCELEPLHIIFYKHVICKDDFL